MHAASEQGLGIVLGSHKRGVDRGEGDVKAEAEME